MNQPTPLPAGLAPASLVLLYEAVTGATAHKVRSNASKYTRCGQDTRTGTIMQAGRAASSWHVQWCPLCWPETRPKADVTADPAMSDWLDEIDPAMSDWLDDTERLVAILRESLTDIGVVDAVSIAVRRSEASRMFGAELVAELLDGVVLCLTIHPPGVTCELDERICVLAARYDPAEGRAARARWDALVVAADMGEHIRRELATLEAS